MPRTDRLDSYLAGEKLKSFSWGVDNGDCLLFLLGWAETIGRADLAQSWRGLYATEDEARALLERRGGAVTAGRSMFGPPRIGTPAVRGDVGLLAHDGWHFGMICTGNMWALRAGLRGIRLTRRPADIVWDMGFL